MSTCDYDIIVFIHFQRLLVPISDNLLMSFHDFHEYRGSYYIQWNASGISTVKNNPATDKSIITTGFAKNLGLIWPKRKHL